MLADRGQEIKFWPNKKDGSITFAIRQEKNGLGYNTGWQFTFTELELISFGDSIFAEKLHSMSDEIFEKCQKAHDEQKN